MEWGAWARDGVGRWASHLVDKREAVRVRVRVRVRFRVRVHLVDEREAVGGHGPPQEAGGARAALQPRPPAPQKAPNRAAATATSAAPLRPSQDCAGLLRGVRG